MLRIGQISESFYPIVDGVGRVVYQYADMLGKAGHDVYVVTPQRDTGCRGRFPFEIVDYVGYPVPGSPQCRFGFSALDSHYNTRTRQISLDIVHTHSPYFAGTEGLRLSVRSKCPLVSTFHSKYYDDFMKYTHSEAIAELGVKYAVDFYRRCDEVWAVSRSTASVLRDYGYNGPVRVMENGSDIRDIRPEDRAAACAAFGLDDELPVLLFVGQLDWKKNLLRILETCALLKTEGLRFHLVMAGQGCDARHIRTKATALGLADVLTFTGHIEDQALLDGLYQRGSIFFFPSIYDNCPMVLREAAVMGTPALVSRGSNPAEVIRDGENGFIADDNTRAMADAAARALSDPEQLTRIGLCARKTIPVSWEHILHDVEGAYAELIERFADEGVRQRSLRSRRGLLNKLESSPL